MLPLPSQRDNLFLQTEQCMHIPKTRESYYHIKSIFNESNLFGPYLCLFILNIRGFVPKDQKNCTHESHNRFHLPRWFTLQCFQLSHIKYKTAWRFHWASQNQDLTPSWGLFLLLTSDFHDLTDGKSRSIIYLLSLQQPSNTKHKIN